MAGSFLTVSQLALLAGLLSLDATAFLQSMVSRPIVAGIAAGAVVGDLGLGVVIGATLELVWIGTMPVGAAVFPDGTCGAVSGAGVAWLLLSGGADRGFAIFLGVAAGLLAGTLGQGLTKALRRANERFAALALAGARRGESGGVARAVALGLATRFALSAGLVAAIVSASAALPGGAIRFQGDYPALLWAAPVGAAAVAAAAKSSLERWLMAAGFGAGLVAFLGFGGG